jgi:hypothetical protein
LVKAGEGGIGGPILHKPGNFGEDAVPVELHGRPAMAPSQAEAV